MKAAKAALHAVPGFDAGHEIVRHRSKAAK